MLLRLTRHRGDAGQQAAEIGQIKVGLGGSRQVKVRQVQVRRRGHLRHGDAGQIQRLLGLLARQIDAQKRGSRRSLRHPLGLDPRRALLQLQQPGLFRGNFRGGFSGFCRSSHFSRSSELSSFCGGSSAGSRCGCCGCGCGGGSGCCLNPCLSRCLSCRAGFFLGCRLGYLFRFRLHRCFCGNFCLGCCLGRCLERCFLGDLCGDLCCCSFGGLGNFQRASAVCGSLVGQPLFGSGPRELSGLLGGLLGCLLDSLLGGLFGGLFGSLLGGFLSQQAQSGGMLGSSSVDGGLPDGRHGMRCGRFLRRQFFSQQPLLLPLFCRQSLGGQVLGGPLLLGLLLRLLFCYLRSCLRRNLRGPFVSQAARRAGLQFSQLCGQRFGLFFSLFCGLFFAQPLSRQLLGRPLPGHFGRLGKRCQLGLQLLRCSGSLGGSLLLHQLLGRLGCRSLLRREALGLRALGSGLLLGCFFSRLDLPGQLGEPRFFGFLGSGQQFGVGAFSGQFLG